jgi:DNA-binding MarR family transcriptional regulator
VSTTRRARWLDQREQRAWRGFLAMHAQLTLELGRQLQRDTDLSAADYGVLVHLSEAPDHQLRAFELGDALQWEKSRLSHQLSRMVQRGLVERRTCPTDARGAHVAITPAGLDAIERAAPLHVAEIRRLFIDALTAEQLDQLAAISTAVLANLGGPSGPSDPNDPNEPSEPSDPSDPSERAG